MTNTQSRDYGAGEFLALLLRQIVQVYDENTDDWASIHALDIAIAAIAADEKLDERSAETILENMAALAGWMLAGNSEFSPAIRARLEAIRDTHPDFAEPKITGVAS